MDLASPYGRPLPRHLLVDHILLLTRPQNAEEKYNMKTIKYNLIEEKMHGLSLPETFLEVHILLLTRYKRKNMKITFCCWQDHNTSLIEISLLWIIKINGYTILGYVMYIIFDILYRKDYPNILETVLMANARSFVSWISVVNFY